MNVRGSKRISRLAKESELQGYVDVAKPQSEDELCDREGYQIVHERGLDPNGEYTDLTANIHPSDATIQKEKMINDFLFPPQKNAPKRFNYTDIQLMPVKYDEEQLPSNVLDDTTATEGCLTIQTRSKPKVKPKPKCIQQIAEKKPTCYQEDEISVHSGEEQVVEYCSNKPLRCSICTWKYCKITLYIVVLVVCISISLVAVALAMVSLTRSSVCEQEFLYEECNITHNSGGAIPGPMPSNNSCTTPPMALPNEAKVILCSYRVAHKPMKISHRVS